MAKEKTLSYYADTVVIYEDDCLIGTLKMFAGENYTLTIDDKIVTPDNLREIANILTELEKGLQQ